MERSKDIYESGIVKSHNNSIGNSSNRSKVSIPSKSDVKSPAKSIVNSSPARQVPLSDYSPLKGGAKSISSFFTPPQPVKISSLSTSPQKATPIMVNSSNLKNQAQVQIDESGSDLTVSEGESDNENVETQLLKSKNLESEEEGLFKAVRKRGIPFNLNEEEDENEDVELEAENENESDQNESDISVIISLPSTDSNDQVIVSKRFADLSNSEYESTASDEEEKEETDNITSLIVKDSDDEETDKIPVMLFSSNQIKVQSSPEKKPKSVDRLPVIPSADMPEMNSAPKRSFEEDLNVVKVSLNNTVLPESVNQPPSPKKRVVDISRIANEFIQNRTGITTSQPSSVQDEIKPVAKLSMTSLPHLNSSIKKMSASHSVHPSQQIIRPGPGPATFQQDQAAVLAINRDQIYGNIHVAAGNPELPVPIQSKTGFVYDERMLHHFDPHDPEHPEKPARITTIYEKLRAAKLLEKSYRIPLQVKMTEFAPEVQSIHDTKYCRMINQTSLIRNIEELHQISSQFNSVYINPSTAISATVAAAATIELCHAIGTGKVENGFAIVRPPGHHAEHDEAMGFCIYNNVAVAASSLLRKGLARKILILDWDVHHGNGTQNAFAESGDVLYISLHRYDNAKFYPHIEEANCSYVGAGTAGLGK